MYLPQSEVIANAHAALASQIERVDALIYTIGSFPIRVDQMSDNVGIEPAQFRRILGLYATARVLRTQECLYCPQCESLVEDEDDEQCDNCEASFRRSHPDRVDVFIVSDPILRADPDVGDEHVSHKAEVRIQFVAGDRGGAQRNTLQTPKEDRAIRDAIRSADYRDFFPPLNAIQAASLKELASLYMVNPTVLHFGGHGDERSLSFVLDQELLAQAVPVTAAQLVAILGAFPQRIRVCVFNTCESANIANEVVNGDACDFAIGWYGKVPDSVAISFAEQLYRHVANGLSLGQAFVLAKQCTPASSVPVIPMLAAKDDLNARDYCPLNP